jgi:predicted acyltransferase
MNPDIDPDMTTSSTRLTSLDAFRGLTIAGMILVNNPGSWEHVYPPLRHASWHGWTPTDLVFPSFLFIVGVAIPLAIGKRRERGDATGSIVTKIVIRSLVIFALGLFLNWFRLEKTDSGYSLPELLPSLARLRIPGVLQRIAVCYLLIALLYLWTGVRTQIAVTVGLLVGYWTIMRYVPVPGHGVGDLSREHNLAAYVDRLLLPGHLYKKDYDPEGLLSTLPALASTLIGVLTGRWLGTIRTPSEKTCGVFAAGVVLFAIGWGWDASFPINKALWTSSFVLYSAGLSLQVLGLCMWLIEVLGVRGWSGPFLVFGSNAIAAYVLSGLAVRFLPLMEVSESSGARENVKEWYIHHALGWADPTFASLLYGLSYVMLWFLVLAVLYRLKWFIRV